MGQGKFKVVTFYKFVPLDNLQDLRVRLLRAMLQGEVKGSILLASEGINATVAGEEKGIHLFSSFLRDFEEFKDITFKVSYCDFPPFKRTKVRLKSEIVTFKKDDLDISDVGEYLDSKRWDDLIKDKDTLLIDSRNDYEVLLGSFKNSVNPDIKNFSEFADWVDKNLHSADKDTKIATFCTGGIRCEKSTSYLKSKGFKNVYHLQGGVLKYLEDKKDEQDSMWEGSCYVFDDRVAVDAKLKPLNIQE